MASLSELKNKVSAICGEIKTMPVNAIPDGWLACDGSSLSRTTYSKLFAKLGGVSSPYGLPDGSSFNIPNFNSGRFLRGTGGNAASIGTGQADRTKKNGLSATAAASIVSGTLTAAGSHNHGGVTGNESNSVWRTGGSSAYGSGTVTAAPMADLRHTHSISTDGSHTHTHSLSAAAQTITVGAGDAETNPINYAVVYCIKY